MKEDLMMNKIDIDKLLNEHKLMVSNDGAFYFDNKEFLVETNTAYHQLYDVRKVKVYYDTCYMDYIINFKYNNNSTVNIGLKGIKKIEIKDIYKKIITNGIYVKIKCVGQYDPNYITTVINNITGIQQINDEYIVSFKFSIHSVYVDKETAEELINLAYMDHNDNY